MTKSSKTSIFHVHMLTCKMHIYVNSHFCWVPQKCMGQDFLHIFTNILMVLQQIQLWCSHQIHSRPSAFSGSLPCTEKENHSNAEQWYTVVKKEKLHHKKLVKRVAYHQKWSCKHHIPTAQPNANIISCNFQKSDKHSSSRYVCNHSRSSITTCRTNNRGVHCVESQNNIKVYLKWRISIVSKSFRKSAKTKSCVLFRAIQGSWIWKGSLLLNFGVQYVLHQ